MDVRLPNGTIIQNVPDDYSVEDLTDLAIGKGFMTLEEYSQASAAADSTPEEVPFMDSDYVGDAFRGVAKGFAATVPLAAEGAGALSYATGLPILPGMDPVKSLKDSELVQWGRQSQKDLAEFIGGDQNSMAYKYGNALGSFASFFVPYLGQLGLAAKGFAGAGKIVGLGGQAGLAVGQGAGEQAERILNLTERSGNEYPAAEENLKQAIIQGGAIGLSELAPVRMFGKIISLGIPRSLPAEARNRILARTSQIMFGTRTGRLASTSVTEGAQEALAGYLQDLTEQGLYNPSLEVGKSAAADFGYGASAAFTFQAALEAMMPGFRRSRQRAPDVRQPQEGEPEAEVVPEETLALPAPPASSTPLLLQDLRDDSETFIQPNESVAPLVEQTISDLAEDLPLSFNRGAIVSTDELGTPDAYSTNSNEKGFFVESKQGVKVSPYFGSSEQAAEFKDGLNLGVNDLLDTQDRAETNRLASEAVKDAGYGPDSANVATGALLEAARQTQVTDSIPAGDLPGDTLTTINARRVQTGQRVFSPDDLLTPGDLAEAGVPSEIVSEVAPSSFNEVTADDIRDLAEQKNILLEDAGFERFSQRLIGNASIDSPSVSPGQLGYLYEAVQQMPVLPGDGPQRLPVIRKPEFSGSQYAAVISLANRKGSDGILKSEINKSLDLKRGAPTEAIIQSGVARGDLIEHPTKKNRWVSRSSYEMESRDLDSPLRRGEQIEGEQRRSEEREAESKRRADEVAEATTRSVLGPGIMIPRSREGAFAGSFDEATANLKARIANVTPTPDAQNRIDAIQESLKRELSRFQRALPEGVKVGDRLDVRLANSVFTPEGVPVEGEINVDGDRIVITLALDLAEAGAKSDVEVKNNLRGVLNHEVIHALKSLNVLSPADFKILERYARKNSRKDSDKTFFEDISERYLEQNEDGTYVVTGTNVPPTQELLVEESIADAFRYWAAGDIKVTGKPRSLFNRIVKFFQSLSSGFSNSNVNSAEQLFDGLRSPLGSMDVEGTAAETRDLARAEARAAERGQVELDFPPDVFVDPKGPRSLVGTTQRVPAAGVRAPRQAPQPDVVSEPDLADPVVVAEREEPVARPDPETVLDAEDESALNKILQAHDYFGYYKSNRGKAFNEQQIDNAKKTYIDLVNDGSGTMLSQVADTARLGRKYGVLVGDGFTGADSYATLENLEALSAGSRDTVKYSLYPVQLDGVARRILGADTVQEGNLTRRVRASDVPREMLSRFMERRLSRDEENALDRQKAAVEGKYSLARKPVDPTDPVFSVKNSKHDDAKIAGKRVAPRGMARRLSVLDLLYNDDLSERRGNNIGYVSRILNARAKRILGSKTGDKGILIENDTSYDNLISDVFAAEALAALEETGNAANWYSEKVSEAVDTAAQLYPEIKTDLDARFAFLAALSVTSQNTPVMENAVYTTEVYNYYRANGRFPEYSKGKHGPSMRDNFIMLNDLLDRMGPQGVRELFESQFTVKELKQAGYNPPSGENVDTVVYGSFLLGPKIGQGFYQNLNGNFEPVTIDMWLMRSIGRVTGRLIGKPELIQVQTDRLIEGLRADPEKRGSNFLIASLFDAKIDGDVDVVVEIADELRREHDRIFKTPEVRALYERKEYNKPEWAKAAEAIVTQQNKPQDAPSGGNFRNAVRRIMDKTRQKVANSGYDVTNADLQAILWYPEKNLYKKLGVRTKENLNIDYAQAFEKILEGGVELDAEGNVLQTVGRGGRAEAVDVAGRVEEDGREISEADGAQVKYSLARPNETLLNFIKNNPEDGFTFDVNGKTVPSSGFAFAPIKGAEIRISSDQLNIAVVDELLDVVQLVQSITNENIYAGGWLDNASGDYFLDASVIIDDSAKALYYAEGARQEAIFDLGEFNEIRTDEGIEGLKASGLYSAEAHANARAAAEALGISFREKRPQDTRKFSLAGDGRRDRGGESRRTQALPGAPTNFSGPIQELVDAAEQYARQNGIDYTRQGEYVKVDEDFARRVAQAYAEMRHVPNDPVVREAYNNLARQTRAQYDALIDAGYTFTFFDSNSDPYQGNPWNAMRDLRDTKTMAVYGTYDGYGTEGITDSDLRDNPMLEDTGLRWKDQQGQDRLVTVNDLFRAVHDAFGHGLEGSGFRSQGEENAWQAHSRLYTGSALGAITSETRGQNSWLNYGPYGESNKNASLFDTVFAEQKTGLMPQFTWSENIAPNFEGETKKYSLARNVENQRRNVVKYTERIGAPLSAYAGKFLEKTNDPKDYSARLLITDDQGKTHPADIMVPNGFDRVITDPANPNRSVGFGAKHFEKHQEKVPVNTYGSYSSIEDLARAAMRAYWPFRNNPEAGGFTIKRQTSPTGNSRYRFEWQSEDFGYPAVFVFEPLYYDVIGPRFVRDNPSYAGKFTAQLVTGWIGSSDKVKDNPIPRPAVSVNPDRTLQVQKSIDRGMNEAINPKEARKTARSILSLKKKYSLKNSGKQLNERQKKIVEDRISEKANDTFFGRIMKSFDMTDPAKRSVGLKIRRQVVDNYAGMRKNASELEKKNIDVGIEANINGAIAQLQRKSGIVQAALTIGPVIYNRGSVHAVSDKLVNKGPEEQQVHFKKAFDQLRDEAVIENYTNPITGETFTLRYENPSDLKGLAEVFREIDENNLWKEFEGYSSARRASRLIQEGREKTFTQEEIDELIDIGRTVPAVERTFQQYQLWNTALINTMKDAGVISEEAAQIWIDNADYLPFWRQFYDNTGTVFEAGDVTETRTGEITYEPDRDSKANRIFDSMYGVNAPRKLKGGRPAYFVMINDVADTMTYSTYEAAENRREQLRKLNPGEKVFVKKTNQRVESPVDNILRNLDAAITSSLTNVTAARAVRDLYKLGLAKKVGAANHNGDGDLSLTTNLVGIRVNGQLVYYEVYDETLLDTLKATGAVQMPGLDLLSTPANVLRELVTKDPGFMAANMLRDSVSSWATSGVTKLPGPGTVSGYVKAITKAPEAEALEAYGVIGGYDAKADAEAVKLFNKINRQKGRGGWNPVTWWNTWDKISMASDSSSRIGVYNRILKDTGNVANATVEALEVINFNRKGAHPGARVASAVIPFLNARAQGLDLIYRAGTRGNSGVAGGNITNAQRRRRFYFRGLAVVALSAAYALAHVHDDPEEDPWYHNATEVDKDNHWIIPPHWFGLDSFFGLPALKIPIPFEVGILFKVIPERIIRFLSNQTDARENMLALKRHVTGTLAVGMPQFMAPVFDTYMNYNSFTGRPIQTYWDKNVRGYITRPGTASPLSIATSKGLYENAGIDIGAKQIDYILRGYTGTLGSYAIMATDSLMRGPAGLASAPSKRLHEYPVLSRFLQEEVGRGPLDAYYDLETQVSLYTDSIKRLEDAGRFEQAEKERQRFPNIPIREDEIKSVKQQMNQLFKLEEQFENDPVLPADEKKALIEEVRRMMNETVRYLYRDRATILERAN